MSGTKKSGYVFPYPRQRLEIFKYLKRHSIVSGTMRQETMPTGDRGVDIYHMLKSTEKWQGFILEVPSPDIRTILQKSLNEILLENGHTGAKIDGNRIYLKGEFGDDIIGQLKKEIDKYMADYSQKPLNVTGSYFDFLGDYWVEEAIEKRAKRSISSQNP